MKRFVLIALAGAVALAACGKSDTTVGKPEMTAEQDAVMPRGDTAPLDSESREHAALSPQQAAGLGVSYTTARRETLTRMIRTVGLVQAPESTLAEITPKIDGFVEELFVNYTGETVRRGQPLLSVYSPMLVAAQNELLTARHLASQIDSSAGEAWASAQAMVESARRRLAYWDITAGQIAEIEKTGQVTKTLTLVAPSDGVVLEKMVVQGQQVMPGMKLYRLANLSSVWIEGEVFEQDLHFIGIGTEAAIDVASHPGERRTGRVSFVYPTVNEASRTARIRVTVRNPGLWLKPGMYATLYFHVRFGGDVPSVPVTAVVMTGERNIVFVRDTQGMLAPRDVTLGATGTDRVEVVQGLREGETVVASANFLLDAESRLAAGGGGMAGMQMGDTPAAAPPRSTVKPNNPDLPGMIMGESTKAPATPGRAAEPKHD